MFNFKQMGVAAAMALGFVVSAHAVTETTTFNVKLTITESCTIKGVSATDVDFGTVARSASVTDAQGAVVVKCSAGTPYKVGLDNGANAVGTQRNMKMGTSTNVIAYDLYTTAARNVPWTDVAGTPVNGTGDNTNQSLPVFGRVSGSTNVPAGAYIDTVTATLSY